MRIELHDGDAAWPIVEPLDKAVYTPEVMAHVPWRDVVWAHADKRVLLWDDRDALVCHVGVFLREGLAGSLRKKIGGIGGVMTHGDARKRGYASAAMREAQRFMRDDAGCDFGLLFCEPHNVPLYRSLGWRAHDGDVLVEQPGGTKPFFVGPMVLDLRYAPAAGTIDLCGLPW